MDKIKDMAKQMQGSSGSSTGGNTGDQDYADKGLAAVEKKTGHSQSSQTNEKITDKGRELYEKESGSKVNSKFSN